MRGATYECELLAAATTPGFMAAHVPVPLAPVTVPVELPVAVMPPLSLISKSVRVPIMTMTEASRVPIVRIGFPAWSTSIPTTFAGVMTVHKLRAFLVLVRLAPATSLGSSLVRSAH
jgi:hypothetical protein